MRDRTGAASEDVARAYLAARAAFEVPQIWQAIEGLDAKVPALVQYRMLAETVQLVERACHWFLKNRPLPLEPEYYRSGGDRRLCNCQDPRWQSESVKRSALSR